MVKTAHPRLSIVRQCMLLGIGRSSFYYAATGESPRNLELMRRIDGQFLETPFFGGRPGEQAVGGMASSIFHPFPVASLILASAQGLAKALASRHLMREAQRATPRKGSVTEWQHP